RCGCYASAGNTRFPQRIFQQTVEGANTVFPPNLFSFFVRASPIADSDFVDTQAAPGHLDCDLRLKTEAVFLDRNCLNHLASKDLVAGFHVGKIDVGQAVGEQRQDPVADGMTEVENPMRPTAEEA